MENPKKPGGGNKPQPYIPAGNGKESGEYTNKNKKIKNNSMRFNCHIIDRINLFNPLKSKLVQKVSIVVIAYWKHDVPDIYYPNSVIKTIINGEINKERYYNEKGEPYLDIHYTDHGNPKAHPKVPHIHKITYINGRIGFLDWEEFE